MQTGHFSFFSTAYRDLSKLTFPSSCCWVAVLFSGAIV